MEPPVRREDSLPTYKLCGALEADERRRRCEKDEVREDDEEGAVEARLEEYQLKKGRPCGAEITLSRESALVSQARIFSTPRQR